MPKLKKECTDSRKQEILKAVWASFMEKGYEKTTMREIADRMNATTGILYTYFKNKEEILEEMQTGIRSRIQQIFSKMSKKESVRETYAGFFTHEFKWPSDNTARKNCRGMVGLLAEALRSKGIRRLMNVSYRDIEEAGSKLIEKGIKNGEINAHINPKAVSGLFQALEWGLWMQIALIDDLDIKAITDNMVKILMGNVWRNPVANEK